MSIDHDPNPLRTTRQEQQKLAMEEEAKREIDRQHHNQQIEKILHDLWLKVGVRVDVVCTKKGDLVDPSSVKLVIDERVKPEHMTLISEAQGKIIRLVESANGHVDFMDRGSVNLDRWLDETEGKLQGERK